MTALASLAEAIAWIEAHWDGQRAAPLRLHVRGEEGRFTVQGSADTRTATYSSDDRLGSPPFSHAFMATLDGSAAATMVVTITTSCSHPGRIPGTACAMCAIYDGEGHALTETGIYERDVERYRYPMTLALTRLANTVPPAGQPHPYWLIMALAGHGFDQGALERSLDLAAHHTETWLLRAIRQLHARYEEGRVPYLDQSDSQRNALAKGA
jgi:hypothetical protein